MKTVKEHTCFLQHLEVIGGDGKSILEALDKCRCRKMLTTKEATEKVLTGMAEWVILDRRPILGEEICPVCAGGDDKETCANCDGFGSIADVRYAYNYSAENIVLVNAPYVEGDREVYSPVNAKQTPRSATVEESHIVRAYVYGNQEDQKRIEIYGISTVLNRVIHPKVGFIPIKAEPADNPEEGTGRTYDWGRAYFAPSTEQRTSGGLGQTVPLEEKPNE